MSTRHVPHMRGLAKAVLSKHWTYGFLFTGTVCMLYKTLINDTYRKASETYFRNYDIDATFEEMRLKGIFQSCMPLPGELEEQREKSNKARS